MKDEIQTIAGVVFVLMEQKQHYDMMMGNQ